MASGRSLLVARTAGLNPQLEPVQVGAGAKVFAALRAHYWLVLVGWVLIMGVGGWRAGHFFASLEVRFQELLLQCNYIHTVARCRPL